MSPVNVVPVCVCYLVISHSGVFNEWNVSPPIAFYRHQKTDKVMSWYSCSKKQHYKWYNLTITNGCVEFDVTHSTLGSDNWRKEKFSLPSSIRLGWQMIEIRINYIGFPIFENRIEKFLHCRKRKIRIFQIEKNEYNAYMYIV